nr:MAG TPA: hypothetical protein [Caudoviricetes sp.]
MTFNKISRGQAQTLIHLLENYMVRVNLELSASMLLEMKNIDADDKGRTEDLEREINNSNKHYYEELKKRLPGNVEDINYTLSNIRLKMRKLITDNSGLPLDEDRFDKVYDLDKLNEDIVGQATIYTLVISNSKGFSFSITMYQDGGMTISDIVENRNERQEYAGYLFDTIADRFSNIDRYNELIYRIMQCNAQMLKYKYEHPNYKSSLRDKKHLNLVNSLTFLKISLTKWGHDGNSSNELIEKGLDELFKAYKSMHCSVNNKVEIPFPDIKLTYRPRFNSMGYKVSLNNDEFYVTFHPYDNGIRFGNIKFSDVETKEEGDNNDE